MAEEYNFQIPTFLQPTEQSLEQNARDQELLRSNHAKRRLSKGEAYIEQFEKQAILSRENLLNLATTHNKEAIQAECNRLAVCLMYLGQFNEALALVTDPAVQVQIEKMQHAVDRDDDESCGCQPSVHGHVKGNLSIHPHFGKDWVKSPKHGKVMRVRECTKCMDWNVTTKIPDRPDDSKYRDPQMAAKVALLKNRK